MRAKVGKPLRSALFRALRAELPGFEPVPGQRVPGFTWDFAWTVGPALVFRLTFQRHKHNDSFTLELAWAEAPEHLDGAPFVDVREGVFGPAGHFRVGALWSGTGDYWWEVLPGRFDGIDLADLAAFEAALLSPEPEIPADLPERIATVVADVVGRLRSDLWPVMVRLARDKGYDLRVKAPGPGAPAAGTGAATDRTPR
jgi:hypothetical protein